MTATRPDIETISDAVQLACRAPSVHNSQPWRWVADRSGLQLFLDTDRRLATDHSGREALLSCGAVLDHLRVAMAASGWIAHLERYPNPNNHRHLAAIDFSPMSYVTGGHRARAEAIARRRTDRLPFGAPPEWDALEIRLRGAIDESVAMLDVIADDARSRLAEASRLTESLRLYDSGYHAELSWWTGSLPVSDGIPQSSLVSAAESDRVDIGRHFPATHGGAERRINVPEDRSKVLVISAHDDTNRDVLRCGETLSQLLLEATMAGMATCTLTHLTELRASRDIVSALVDRDLPQVLVRVGTAPAVEDAPPPTPRRRLDEVLEVRS
ncbi:putative NAD(P)H nitroreductase acg [Mycolicibacterium doricum]|uniref:NAD(P)H nitroreductase n=1 Tax=Mycolicibacterium doricum TaxID=126673 RepID=A0A1X1SZR1_9MYCO|nr:NAD(P)H nitroreductase [Mycolicibacterium doricum]MCV7268287.1 NAD(P)H nitroreductase [Mycolicibacterium doricum]ORV37395.1 NAD(P)H nitroreductase [Mycolicibacterium doricum]BBZ06510.1 putative NAD(P)H nitroreductase acg [Mycolicibacterium doricum]